MTGKHTQYIAYVELLNIKILPCENWSEKVNIRCGD
jgi:hypothetical protein